MIRFIRRPMTLLCAGMCCIAFIAVIACGKKAPPVAPQQRPMAAVADLTAELDPDTRIVRLTWSHNPDNWGVVKYLILRAQTALDQEDCPGCPLVFQKVDEIAVPRALRREKHALDFSQQLAEGFRYTFDVRPVQPSGAQGPGSNPAILEAP